MPSGQWEVPSVRRGVIWQKTPVAPGSYVVAAAQLKVGQSRCHCWHAAGVMPLGWTQTPGLLATLSPPTAKHPASKALTLQLTLNLPAKHLSHQGSCQLQATWAQKGSCLFYKSSLHPAAHRSLNSGFLATRAEAGLAGCVS